MEVKWIKIYTDIFNNKKIKQIEAMPDADAILVIWLKLLVLAGTVNEGGYIYLADDIPYTEEMLAVEFGKPINTIRLALKILEQYRMIEIIDNVYYISNWDKYQSTDKLNQIREQTRKRVARFREKQKQLETTKEDCNVTCNAGVTLRNATDIDIDIDIDKEDIKREYKNPPLPFAEIKDYWNSNSKLANIRLLNQTRKTAVKNRVKDFDIPTIYKVIDLVSQSNFLQGKNNRGWKATFDWVFKASNFIKVLEGNYQNDKGSDKTPDWYEKYERQLKELPKQKELSEFEKQKILDEMRKK